MIMKYLFYLNIFYFITLYILSFLILKRINYFIIISEFKNKRSLFFEAFDRPLIYLCACVRSEGEYLQEWIDYHLSAGFDKIVLFDNNIKNNDRSLIMKIQNNRVIVIDRRNIRYGTQLQAKWYNEFYQNLRPIDWCLYIDVDEFFTLKNLTLREYITSASHKKCDQIKINWLCYGNNGKLKKEQGSVVERFPQPVIPFTFKVQGVVWNSHIKSFIHGGNSVHFVDVHSAEGKVKNCNGNLEFCYKSCKLNNNYPLCYDKAYLRHYSTKSEEEFLKKIQERWNGSSSCQFSKYVHSWGCYNEINKNFPNIPYKFKNNVL